MLRTRSAPIKRRKMFPSLTCIGGPPKSVVSSSVCVRCVRLSSSYWQMLLIRRSVCVCERETLELTSYVSEMVADTHARRRHFLKLDLTHTCNVCRYGSAFVRYIARGSQDVTAYAEISFAATGGSHFKPRRRKIPNCPLLSLSRLQFSSEHSSKVAASSLLRICNTMNPSCRFTIVLLPL